MAEKHIRELIPGDNNQSVCESFAPITQNRNGGEPETPPRSSLFKAEYLGCVAEGLAEKKARGHQPPDSFCCRAAPTCVLEASVTSDTSADG